MVEFQNSQIRQAVIADYDPGNLSTVLYDSNQAGTRDVLDYAAKYTVPLVADGKVFVVSESHLTAYGQTQRSALRRSEKTGSL